MYSSLSYYHQSTVVGHSSRTRHDVLNRLTKGKVEIATNLKCNYVCNIPFCTFEEVVRVVREGLTFKRHDKDM